MFCLFVWVLGLLLLLSLLGFFFAASTNQTCDIETFVRRALLDFFLGRRYLVPGTDIPEFPEIPLEIYTVRPNRVYKFRFINTGSSAAFRISFDEVGNNHVTFSFFCLYE